MTARLVCGALLLGALMPAGCGNKPGPAEAAKVFFDRIAAGKVDEAYDNAAFGFQIHKPRQFFAAMVRELGLADIAAATYSAPTMAGRTATVRGEFTTGAGASFALVVTMIQDAGAWRVYALKSPGETGRAEDRFRLSGRLIGLADATNRQPIPADAALRKLIADAVTRFGNALKTESFDDFFDSISRRWQLQLIHRNEPAFDYETAMRRDLRAGDRDVGSAHFVRAFRAFYDHSLDFTNLADIPPVFTEPPYLSTDGLLLVAGYFPAQPHRVNFALKFIYEPPAWRVFGIDVLLEDPPPR